MSTASVTTRLDSFRFTSVGSKLAGSTVALMLVVTVGVYLRLSGYQRESLLHSKEVGASAVARLFADSSAPAIVFEDEAAIKEELTTLGRNQEVVYAAVWGLDHAGLVGRQFGELRRGAAEIAADVPAAIQLRRTQDRVILTASVRDQAGQAVGVAVVAFSLARENQAIASVERSILVVSASLALGLLVLLLVMARLAIVGPLGKLVVAAKVLEEGGTAQLDVRTNDEVGELAHAFRRMAAAIQIREQRIGARNRDMRLVLDNVGQGFVTLDNQGAMSEERSRVVDEWFGTAAAGVKFWTYLTAVDATVGEWFELGWEAVREDVLPLPLCLEQLPASIHTGGKTFELAYRPILEGDQLDKLIVVITDVTVRVEREHAEQAQREMMSIFRRTLADRAALDAFFIESSVLVDAIISDESPNLVELRHHVHTLKGNTALFGIESVARYCHQLEDWMNESPEAISSAQRSTLGALWTKVKDMRAQLTGDRPEEVIELGRGEFAAFMTDLHHHHPHELLAATATAWQFEPATKRLQLFGEQIRSLADRLGRAPVEIRYSPTTLRLPPRKWGAFWSVFAHLIRNTVDHGVEATEDRIAAGKSATATVDLGVTREGSQVVVTIADDGRGIDWSKIAVTARERGMPHATNADLEDALFAEGFSSRKDITSTSGRGIGLAAVRTLVRELGGSIEIRTEAGRGTTFRVSLPLSMLIEDVESEPARRPERSPAHSISGSASS